MNWRLYRLNLPIIRDLGNEQKQTLIDARAGHSHNESRDKNVDARCSENYEHPASLKVKPKPITVFALAIDSFSHVQFVE